MVPVMQITFLHLVFCVATANTTFKIVTYQFWRSRGGIFKLLGSPGIYSKESIPPAYLACAGIFKQSNRGQEPSRNSVVVPALQVTQPGGIGSLESILGLLKRLKLRILG